jgi:hypothetical protein
MLIPLTRPVVRPFGTASGMTSNHTCPLLMAGLAERYRVKLASGRRGGSGPGGGHGTGEGVRVREGF